MRITDVRGGARYFELRLLLEDNELSIEEILPWGLFTRN